MTRSEKTAKNLLIPFALAAAIMAVFAAVNLPLHMGAHPWWSRWIILYGAPFGLLAATPFVFRAPRPAERPFVPAMIAGLFAVLSYGLARAGKARFVNSSGDDSFGGVLWFNGWIAVAAFTALCLTLTVHAARRDD